MTMSYVEAEHQQLLLWMKQRGHTKECFLAPAEFVGTGRGLKALHCFKPGSILVSIPEKLLITGKMVLGTYLGEIIKSFPPQKFSTLDCLCTFLMCERHKAASSDWLPYIALLPKTYSNAAHWTEQEMTLLPEHVKDLAQHQHSTVRASYKDLQSFFECTEKRYPSLRGAFSLECYLWAWSSVNTRCVYLKQNIPENLRKSEADDYALAPLLDLLNHSATAQVEAGFNEQNLCYEIRTQTAYNTDEEVLINYGPHNNAKLLVEYGFLLKDNPNNVLPCHADDLRSLGESLKLDSLNERMDIILESELHMGLFCSMEGLSWNLEMALGVLALQQTQLCQWREQLMGDHRQQATSIEVKIQNLAVQLLGRKKAAIHIPHLRDSSSLHKKLAQQICQDFHLILDACLATVS